MSGDPWGVAGSAPKGPSHGVGRLVSREREERHEDTPLLSYVDAVLMGGIFAVGYFVPRFPSPRSTMNRPFLLSPTAFNCSTASPALFSSSTCSVTNHWSVTWAA